MENVMSQEKSRNQDYFTIDFSYVFRCLWRNAWVILMCACIAGMLSYIFLDNYQKDTYTASVKLSVVSRENTAVQLVERNMDAAVNQCLNVLNSNILEEQIYKKDTEHKLSGDYSANRVPESNVITLQATSASAEAAFCLLQAALDEFPTLSSYFDFGYQVKTLEVVSANNITVNHAGSADDAVLIALLTAFCGIGLTGVLCLFTDVIHSKEQAEIILDTDILGVQHYIKKGSNQKAILITDENTEFSYLEEIEKLVTRLQEKMTEKEEKVLMVSSMRENEGKTTIAANVALCMAKRGKRVLLMEGDLRRPAVYKVFEKQVKPECQVSQCLEGKASWEQCVYSDEKTVGISYLLQEKAVSQPDKLLENGSFKEMLEQMKEKMDYIIIDTPPTGIVRDSEIIAGCADASLLVVRQDYVRGAVVNDVVDVLDDAGTDVLGVVLTMAKGRELSSFGRGSYGGYYYGYGLGRYGYYYGYGRSRKEHR